MKYRIKIIGTDGEIKIVDTKSTNKMNKISKEELDKGNRVTIKFLQ